jgi:hypothetical protein
LNKERIPSRVYRNIPNQSVLQFGQSARMYILHLPCSEPDVQEPSIVKKQELSSAALKPKSVADGTWYEKDPQKILTQWLDERGGTFRVEYEEEKNGSCKTYIAYVDIPTLSAVEVEDSNIPSIRGQGWGNKKKEAEKKACLDACHKLAASGLLHQSDIATTVDDYDRKMKHMLKRKTQDRDDDEEDSFYDRTGDSKIPQNKK